MSDRIIAEKLNLLIYNCSFCNENTLDFSSLTVFLSSRCSSVNVSYCTFNNVTNLPYAYVPAAAILISCMIYDQTCSSTHLSNVTVKHSKSRAKIIDLNCLYIGVQVNIRNIQVLDNNATGILCDRCALHFRGHSIIANNTTPYVGGCLVVNDGGYAVTEKYASVIFINNTASKGGALYSNTNIQSITLFSRLHCTFLDFKAQF